MRDTSGVSSAETISKPSLLQFILLGARCKSSLLTAWLDSEGFNAIIIDFNKVWGYNNLDEQKDRPGSRGSRVHQNANREVTEYDQGAEFLRQQSQICH